MQDGASGPVSYQEIVDSQLASSCFHVSKLLSFSGPISSRPIDGAVKQAAACRKPSSTSWTLGAETVAKAGNAIVPGDVVFANQLLNLPLDPAGVHEIKPVVGSSVRPAQTGAGLSCDRSPSGQQEWPAAWRAARLFASILMVRRKLSLAGHNPAFTGSEGDAGTPFRMLWCLTRRARSENGVPFTHGFADFGLRADELLFVETHRDQDTLWTLEEAIKSESLDLVVAILDDVSLTPARRLALAATRHGTPCLLITHPRSPGMAATALRWEVGPAPSAPHPLLGNSALGAPRLSLTLARSRSGARHLVDRKFVLEWSDEAVCMPVVCDVSDRSPEVCLAQGRS